MMSVDYCLSGARKYEGASTNLPIRQWEMTSRQRKSEQKRRQRLIWHKLRGVRDISMQKVPQSSLSQVRLRAGHNPAWRRIGHPHPCGGSQPRKPQNRHITHENHQCHSNWRVLASKGLQFQWSPHPSISGFSHVETV